MAESKGQFITPGLTRPDGLVPEQFVLPDHNALLELSRTPEGQAQLLGILEQYGITEPLEVAKSRAIALSQRLQTLPPGSPAYARVEAEVIERYTQSELLGMTRYVDQTYSSLVAIDGDKGKEMIWLTEDDASVCDTCAQRGGEIHTYAEWEELGLPGTVCEGGTRCRCDLILID